MKGFVHLRGYPRYQINRLGKIKGPSGKILKPRPCRGGYQQVAIFLEGGRIEKYIHHLVLEQFIGSKPDGQEARHLNGNNQDNRLSNLAWGTPLENGADRVRHQPNCKRCNRPLEGRNLMMVKNGRGNMRVRKCRACHNERSLAWHNANNAARRQEVAGR